MVTSQREVEEVMLELLPEQGGWNEDAYLWVTDHSTRLIEFSDGFDDLHTRVYQETLAGRGFGIDDARPSLELVHRIRHAEIASRDADPHPLARAGSRS